MLATWKQYINDDDFAKLNDFVTCTQNHTKQNKVYVLYGTGSNGKSTFCDELINTLGDGNAIKASILDFKKYKNLSNKNLIIVEEPDCITFQQVNHMLQFMNNADVSPHTNIMFVSNRVDFFEQYNSTHDQLFEIVNFTHVF
jgi:adenylylsulfate kinase-like enzyme